jgi:hypothetical protein
VSFAFLNPWLWLGALAVTAPLWLHLHRKRERNLVRFAAVQFLEDQPKARRARLKVRDVALLLVRSLAVFLIAGAFAWPYLRRQDPRAITRSVVYLLDNSLSRQANDGFNHDKQRIVHDLGAARPATQVAVLDLTATPQLVVGFGEDPRTALQKVRALQPSFGRGSYLDGFRQANALLAEAPGAKQIIFLGDNQANQWQENPTIAPFLRQVGVELPKPAMAQLPNVWLCELRAQRVLLGETSRVNFTMRLGHLGPARSAKVILKANGRTVFERTVNLEGQPQMLSVEAQCEADPAAWLKAEADIEGTPDALPADNHVSYAVPPVTEGRVALLAQSPYLRLGLSQDVMRGRWQVRRLDPARLETEAAAEPAEVLCLESAYLQSSAGRALLKRYLDARRGVLLAVGQLSPAIDGCLQELGFEPEGLVQPGGSQPDHFQFVFSNHSIFRPFESTDFGDLTEVTVSRYARLRPRAGRPLVFSQAGDGLFFESTKYPGKLFVSAFGFDRAETSWPTHPSFIPFLDLALQAARPQDSFRTAFEPGEAVVLPIARDPVAHTVALRENGRELSRAAVGHAQATLHLPDKPGLYALTLDDSADIYRMFAVNPPARESELVFVESPQIVRQWSVNERHRSGTSKLVEPDAAGFSTLLNQHIWWWMLVAGLLALALETTWTLAKENAFESA